jgi:hypothetical protein
MKTTTQIIRETIAHYNRKNLSISEYGSCKYLMEDGRMCAVGRCMTETGINRFGKFQGDIHKLISKHHLTDEEFDGYLKEEYRGHSVNFWKTLQRLHDDDINWGENGFFRDEDFLYGTFGKDYNPEEANN